MESTQDFHKTIDLTVIPAEPPTHKTLFQYAEDLCQFKKKLEEDLCHDTITKTADLKEKVINIIKAGKAYLSMETEGLANDLDEHYDHEVRSILKTQFSFMKLFTLTACVPLHEQLEPLQEICIQDEDKLKEKLLKINPSSEATFAEGTVNRALNKYGDVIPYDFNRVTLESGEYISASDACFDDYRCLIASAPFKRGAIDTRSTWWEMILEKNTRLIVMTTNVFENKKAKCAEYYLSPGFIKPFLPDNWKCLEVKKDYVATKGEESIIRRRIQLVRLDEEDQVAEEREITHLQYHNWPDFGIADPKQFLMLQEIITEEEEKFPTRDHPTLFHCSAGCGRTGTTLAAHLLIRSIKKHPDPREASLDIDGCIASLREQRVGMVQTVNQYRMIAKVLIEYCS